MRIAVVASVVASAVVGCGSTAPKPDEQQVSDAVTSLYRAGERGDAAAVCDRLDQQQRANDLPGSEPCEQQARAIRDAKIEAMRIVDVDVVGDAATVTATARWGDGMVELRREEGEWRVSDFPLLDEHWETGG